MASPVVASLVQTIIVTAVVPHDEDPGVNSDQGRRLRRTCIKSRTRIIIMLVVLDTTSTTPRTGATITRIPMLWAIRRTRVRRAVVRVVGTVDLIRDLRVAVVVLIVRRRMAAQAVRRSCRVPPRSCIRSTTTTITCIRTVVAVAVQPAVEA